jgi:hypothetical protein
MLEPFLIGFVRLGLCRVDFINNRKIQKPKTISKVVKGYYQSQTSQYQVMYGNLWWGKLTLRVGWVRHHLLLLLRVLLCIKFGV